MIVIVSAGIAPGRDREADPALALLGGPNSDDPGPFRGIDREALRGPRQDVVPDTADTNRHRKMSV